MSDPRDYKLDLSSQAADPAAAQSETSTPGPSSSSGRPFLSVHFACCGVYQRVYRDASGASYQGHCPRCGVPVRFTIGEGGTAARFFRVS